jgi:hypothetical protein
MNSDGLELGGTASFASADFPDANETSLYDYSIAFETNYSNAVTNAVFKHYNEIKDKQPNVIESLSTVWKKRFREFLTLKNAKILEFLSCKIKAHPVLSKAEQFISTFGKKNLNINQQSIREVVLDVSSNNIIEDYDAVLLSKEMLPIEKFIEQVQYFMDEYKLAGDKILDKENLLKHKLDAIDLIQAKLKNIVVINENPHYNELMEVTQKYFDKVYEDNSIEEDYNILMDEYRRFIYLRDVLKTVRTVDISEKEPLCTICFSEGIQHAFVPCGHTFCGNCVRKQSTTCAVCRSTVRDRVKLYFS